MTPGVKWLLIINTGLFLLRFLFEDSLRALFVPLMLRPSAVVESLALWQLVTYSFLHSATGFGHILLNMLMLWMFGSTLEQTWGTQRFVKYYLACGAGAGVCVVLLNYLFGAPNSFTIGASGAIYGLLLAFGVLFPDTVILFMFIFPMKARWFVVLMGAIVFLSTLRDSGGGVSHIAHLGGMLTGLILLRGGWLSRRAARGSFNFLRDAERWYRDWKFRRAKRKFQVYMQEQSRDRDRRVQ